MESKRNRKKIELVTDALRMQKLVNKPTFKDVTIYSENLCAVHLKNIEITFDKPIACGMAILDISKTLMYDFHYNVMKKHYKNNISLMYMDTGIFILCI